MIDASVLSILLCNLLNEREALGSVYVGALYESKLLVDRKMKREVR